MELDKNKSFQSFRLRHYQEKTGDPNKPHFHRFVLQELSGKQREKGFGSFEQVVNFILDELEIPKRSNR
jgi:hypothetical protein